MFDYSLTKKQFLQDSRLRGNDGANECSLFKSTHSRPLD